MGALERKHEINRKEYESQGCVIVLKDDLKLLCQAEGDNHGAGIKEIIT